MARSTSGSNRKSSFWGGFALGLIFGLGLAVAVAVLVGRKSPFVAGPIQEEPATVPQPVKPAKPEKPARPTEAPTYDFYKSLPANTNTGATGPSPPQQAEAPPLWLQAGSFQDPGEADNLKARLALLGMEATVESATLPDKGTVYRVRVGPLKDAAELDDTRQRLTENSIPAEPVTK
jgi:cell division protein FtsN